MNLSFKIAKRYLFSEKSHNAINLISMVSVCGIAVATLAMVCALSVFNGFKDLVSDMFSAFDPQLKITAVQGKVFDSNDSRIQTILQLSEVEIAAGCLQDHVLIKYRDKQVPATLKGVPDDFAKLSQIDSLLIDGRFTLFDGVNSYGTLGIGLARNLGVNAGFIYPMEIYAPKREARVNLANPSGSFNQEYAYIGGVFMLNQPVYDDQLIIVPLQLAKEILGYTSEVSSFEIKLKEGSNAGKTQKKIQEIAGKEYLVQNQYEQQENAFKMMNIEKWMTFLILCLIMTIAIFNVVGSLSMLIIEKKADIMTLRNLGADSSLIARIFLMEGWLISMLGGVIGIVIGLILCLAQQYFGLLRLGSQSGLFVVDAYPVRVEIGDVLFIFFTVMSIGFLAMLYPVRKSLAHKKD